MYQKYGSGSRAEKTPGSMFLPKPNPCGYRIDINNPDVLEKYKAYKIKHGIAYNDPMSNRERHAFETEIFQEEFQKNGIKVLKNGR